MTVTGTAPGLPRRDDAAWLRRYVRSPTHRRFAATPREGRRGAGLRVDLADLPNRAAREAERQPAASRSPPAEAHSVIGTGRRWTREKEDPVLARLDSMTSVF
jgi:hypothetical protein